MNQKPHLKTAPIFDIDKEMNEIMSIPCSQAMPRIWVLHRMLKKAANELPPLVLFQAFDPSPAEPKSD